MRTILLIQLFQEATIGPTALEVQLSSMLGSQLVAIDSFSDGANLAYARQLVEGSTEITAIIWEVEKGVVKGLQPLFNALLKKKQAVALITHSSQGVVQKMTKAIRSQVVRDEQELMAVLSNQLNP